MEDDGATELDGAAEDACAALEEDASMLADDADPDDGDDDADDDPDDDEDEADTDDEDGMGRDVEPLGDPLDEAACPPVALALPEDDASPTGRGVPPQMPSTHASPNAQSAAVPQWNAPGGTHASTPHDTIQIPTSQRARPMAHPPCPHGLHRSIIVGAGVPTRVT